MHAPQVETNPSASDGHERRIKQLMLAFQRELNRRPTTLERMAMRRASVLTARAEALADDPTAAAYDIARLDNCASRARAALFAAFGRRAEFNDAVALDELLP